MAVRGERGIKRVLEKLEASISLGKYYEAHQMYRTIYFRLLAQGKYSELLDILEKGSTLLLTHDQQESGVDLANLFVEVMVKAKTPVNEEWIDKAVALFVMMSPKMQEREVFLANATKWSMDGHHIGHPELHKKIAFIFWKEKNYPSSRQHFLHSSDASAYAAMLIEMHRSKGFKGEMDLFVAQASLQLLAQKKLAMAHETFTHYVANHPEIDNSTGPPYKTPLLNFLWLLFKSIKTKQVSNYNSILEKYSNSIKRDPTFAGYIEKIGQIYFDIPPPVRNRPNGLFGNLISSFLGQLEAGESSSEDESGQAPIAPETVAPLAAPRTPMQSSDLD